MPNICWFQDHYLLKNIVNYRLRPPQSQSHPNWTPVGDFGLTCFAAFRPNQALHLKQQGMPKETQRWWKIETEPMNAALDSALHQVRGYLLEEWCLSLQYSFRDLENLRQGASNLIWWLTVKKYFLFVFPLMCHPPVCICTWMVWGQYLLQFHGIFWWTTVIMFFVLFIILPVGCKNQGACIICGLSLYYRLGDAYQTKHPQAQLFFSAPDYHSVESPLHP